MTDLQKIEAILQVFGVSYQKGTTTDSSDYLQYADLVLYFNEEGELVEVEE